MSLRQLLHARDGLERSRLYNLWLHRGAVARRSRLDPRRPGVVRLTVNGSSLAATLPRQLLRALGWHRRDYVHVALTDEGRSLTVRFFARL